MIVPAENIVESLDLGPEDVWLPLFECVSNSVLSLINSPLSPDDRFVKIKLIRGDLPSQPFLGEETRTIRNFVIEDNGVGFTEVNFASFKTPFSKTYRSLGCKGLGRFTVIGVYERMEVVSNYQEGVEWRKRAFKFDKTNEISSDEWTLSETAESITAVTLQNCIDRTFLDRTAVSGNEVAHRLIDHFLVHYLTGTLPKILIEDSESTDVIDVSVILSELSREREKPFDLGNVKFSAYVTKSPKKGNRRNHYVRYCANSRVVGEPQDLGRINSLFAYPISDNGNNYFIDAYVTSDYLDRNVFNSRNGFRIPNERSEFFERNGDAPTFDEIDRAVAAALSAEYNEFIKESSDRSVREVKEYIKEKAPRYSSFINQEEILKSIPANSTDEKKEEHLNRIAFRQREQIDKSINEFIEKKQLNRDSISEIIRELKAKSVYDRDSLADYLMRRKAIIQLFEKFLQADQEGKYRLEEDIHNLIFPMGLSLDEVDYESHNLWLLDERFVTYRYIGSNKTIGSVLGKKSASRPDIVATHGVFDNPISFGDKDHGDISSLVVFEFKRPGQVAHQKGKSDFRWDFADLTNKYFQDFLYAPNKVKHKGMVVNVREATPKFGYIVLDTVPKELEDYNLKFGGWKKTPFNTYFRINSEVNLHLEVLTFYQLLEFAKNRHVPFFNKLFAA